MGVDYRLIFQCLSFATAVSALVIFAVVRIKYGRISSSATGAIALAAHIIVFYAAVCSREYLDFDIILIINNSLFGYPALAYGDWSSAIRLQTIVSVLLMSLTVARRERWINLTGLK